MKKMNLKQSILRLLAVVLCVAICFTLGACGGDKPESDITVGDGDEYVDLGEMTVGDGTKDNNTDSNESTDKGTDTDYETGSNANSTSTTENGKNDYLKNIPQKLQGSTVTFAVWGDENASEYAKVAKLFTKKTKINVKFVEYDEAKYISTIVEQNAAGKGPDIVITNCTFPTAVEAVQELPSYFNLNDGFWDKRVTEALSAKGKKYFVNSYNSPFLSGGVFVFYNKRLFSNNNITSPQDYVDRGEWTFENLEKCLREAYAKGFDGGSIQPIELWPAFNAGLLNYDPSTATFTSGLNNATQKSDIVASLKFVAKLYKEGVISNNPLRRFGSGNMAIAVTGNYGTKFNGWFKDISPSSLGIVNLPDTFNGKKTNYMGTYQRGYGIGKDAKNIEGAYYFLRFFLDLDNYSEAKANIFVNKNVERFYKEQYLPKYKTSPLIIEYMTNPLSLAGSPWTAASAGDWQDVYIQVSPEEVEVALNARANIVENAAKKATEKIQSAIK